MADKLYLMGFQMIFAQKWHFDRRVLDEIARQQHGKSHTCFVIAAAIILN